MIVMSSVLFLITLRVCIIILSMDVNKKKKSYF